MAIFRQPDPSPPVVFRGGKSSISGDWYHLMLRAPWWASLVAIVGAFVLINCLFALSYWEVGGIDGARPGVMSDLFFFSVETMGTVGYGAMHPASFGAHVLTSCETLVGIVLVALCTGLVFSKFSAIRARATFASSAVVAPVNGSPMLMFRIGHERSTPIVDVMIRVVLTRTERTTEGVRMYRMYDLELERDRAPVAR